VFLVLIGSTYSFAAFSADFSEERIETGVRAGYA